MNVFFKNPNLGTKYKYFVQQIGDRVESSSLLHSQYLIHQSGGKTFHEITMNLPSFQANYVTEHSFQPLSSSQSLQRFAPIFSEICRSRFSGKVADCLG